MLVRSLGCSLDEDEMTLICYNQFMDSVILAKYKVDIFKVEQKKAEDAYRKKWSRPGSY